MIRGRVLLDAHVPAPVALWVWRQIEDRIGSGMRFYADQGRPELARMLARAGAQLRTAGEAWLEEGTASADGSAEEVTAEAEAPSWSDDLLVTTGWVATRLGVSSSRVRQLTRSGVLRGRHDGGVWLIERVSVDEYLALKELSA